MHGLASSERDAWNFSYNLFLSLQSGHVTDTDIVIYQHHPYRFFFSFLSSFPVDGKCTRLKALCPFDRRDSKLIFIDILTVSGL